jgi:hypothetical protein
MPQMESLLTMDQLLSPQSKPQTSSYLLRDLLCPGLECTHEFIDDFKAEDLFDDYSNFRLFSAFSFDDMFYQLPLKDVWIRANKKAFTGISAFNRYYAAINIMSEDLNPVLDPNRFNFRAFRMFWLG